ncbi:MAG: GNAT family N-acetyltransferase [Jiangellaceae bacterium]
MLIRPATRADVPAIVALLVDDEIGATREQPDDLVPYLDAFERIDADPGEVLVVADVDGAVVGTLQLTIIPGLSRVGTTRAQIEGVRVGSGQRGSGLGAQLIQWAIDEARARGALIVQLTSDLKRVDAHRFYERLGFEATHAGFKLTLH